MPKYSDVKDTKITVQSIYSIFLRTLEDADTFRKNPRVSQYDTVDGRGRSLDSGRARYRRKKGWASDTVERYMSKNEAAFLLLCDQAEEISKVMYKYKLESAKKVYAFAKGKAKNPDLAKRSFLKNSEKPAPASRDSRVAEPSPRQGMPKVTPRAAFLPPFSVFLPSPSSLRPPLASLLPFSSAFSLSLSSSRHPSSLFLLPW